MTFEKLRVKREVSGEKREPGMRDESGLLCDVVTV